jgi:hypothetical protein
MMADEKEDSMAWRASMNSSFLRCRSLFQVLLAVAFTAFVPAGANAGEKAKYYEDVRWVVEVQGAELPRQLTKRCQYGDEFQDRKCEQEFAADKKLFEEGPVSLTEVEANLGPYDFKKKAFPLTIPGVLGGDGQNTVCVTLNAPATVGSVDDLVAKPLVHMLPVPEDVAPSWKQQNWQNLRAQLVGTLSKNWKVRLSDGDQAVGQTFNVLAWRIYNDRSGEVLVSTPPSKNATVQTSAQRVAEEKKEAVLTLGQKGALAFTNLPPDGAIYMRDRIGSLSSVPPEEYSAHLVKPGVQEISLLMGTPGGRGSFLKMKVTVEKGEIVELNFGGKATNAPNIVRTSAAGRKDGADIKDKTSGEGRVVSPGDQGPSGPQGTAGMPKVKGTSK